LGKAPKIDKITVYWTGGNKQTITDIKANQRITIIETPQKKSNRLFIYLSILVACIVVGFIFLKRRKIR